MNTIEVTVHGRKYLWNGESWTDERFLRPPLKVRGQLMSRLVRQLKRTPLKELDVDLVTSAARVCIDEGYLDDARRLAQRALKADPDSVTAAAVLAAVLRKSRLPRRALKVTEPFQRRRNAELLTVRAAAFCDISDWDNAEKLVRRAVALDRAESPETMKVMARVVAARSRSAA